MSTWPRLFLPSDVTVETLPSAEVEPTFVLDTFVLDELGGDASEVMTGLDALGGIALWPLDRRDERLSSIQEHLAHAEVTTSERRRIEVAPSGLWMFAIELVEQLPDAPGANDPIYLYGTLRSARDPSLPARAGQLTSTRADVLRGLVEGVRWAFRYPSATHERAPRALHLMLPGDRADAIAGGQGVVLAYPAIDPALLSDHAGNEPQVLHIFHDVLKALIGDADHARPEPGFLKSLFSKDDVLPAPGDATLEGYAKAASDELGRLPSWPSPASKALFGRVGPWSGVLRKRPPSMPPAVPAKPPRLPKAPTPEVSAPAPRPPDGVSTHVSHDDWMQDFIAPHTLRKPQLTELRAKAPRSPTKPARPDWMKDFD